MIRWVKKPVPIKVDVRIITATDQNLEAAVKKGTFSEALFNRLGIKIELPPLRERKEDIPLLVHFFVDEKSSETKAFSHNTVWMLMRYDWQPGNLHKLREVINEAISKGQEVVFPWHLPDEIRDKIEEQIKIGISQTPSEDKKYLETLKEVEKKQILKGLNESKWNKKRAAATLGITRQTLDHKIKEYQIQIPDECQKN